VPALPDDSSPARGSSRDDKSRNDGSRDGGSSHDAPDPDAPEGGGSGNDSSDREASERDTSKLHTLKRDISKRVVSKRDTSTLDSAPAGKDASSPSSGGDRGEEGDAAVRVGDRLTYEDLQAAAHRLLSASDDTHADMAERLGVAPVSISKAVTEPGRKFRRLQMQIVETLTGLRLEIEEWVVVREEPTEEGGESGDE
jgi:hypothetical protein